MTETKVRPQGETPTRSPEATFHRIRDARTSMAVVDQITFAIRAGRYRPGDRLPTAQELGVQMGVSKQTIIDALRILTDARVLRARRGAAGGISVVTDSIPLTLLGTSGGWRDAGFRELLEARRAVETELALLAGVRATERDFEELRSAMRELTDEGVDPQDMQAWIRSDQRFHYAIGRAAQSEMLAFYQHQINNQVARLLADVPDDHAATVMLHALTLAALESRDPDTIRSAMNRHLAWLEDFASKGGGTR